MVREDLEEGEIKLVEKLPGLVQKPSSYDPAKLTEWRLQRQKQKMFKQMDDDLRDIILAFKRRLADADSAPAVDWAQESGKGEALCTWPDMSIKFPTGVEAIMNGNPLGVFEHRWSSNGRFKDASFGADALKVLEDSEQVKGPNPTSAVSEMASMELLGRMFKAKLHRTEIDLAMGAAVGVDFSCEIGGVLYGVSVTRSHISRSKDCDMNDSVVIRAAEAIPEPTEGTCNICNSLKDKNSFSNKQWKRVRALLMGRGGLGGCCIGCTGARVQQAQREDKEQHKQKIAAPAPPAPSHLMCAACKKTHPTDMYAKFNDDAKHPLGPGAYNADDVLAEQPELPSDKDVAELSSTVSAHLISKVLCRACTHNKKRHKIQIRGLNDPKAVEALLNKKIEKLLSGEVWERRLLHVWVPDDEHAELACKSCRKIFEERKLGASGNFGVLLSIAKFNDVELVDSYLFGRYLVLT